MRISLSESASVIGCLLLVTQPNIANKYGGFAQISVCPNLDSCLVALNESQTVNSLSFRSLMGGELASADGISENSASPHILVNNTLPSLQIQIYCLLWL